MDHYVLSKNNKRMMVKEDDMKTERNLQSFPDATVTEYLNHP